MGLDMFKSPKQLQREAEERQRGKAFKRRFGGSSLMGSMAFAAVEFQQKSGGGGADFEQWIKIETEPFMPGSSPTPRTVLTGASPEEGRKKRKRRRHRTLMGGYGEARLGKPGLLGI